MTPTAARKWAAAARRAPSPLYASVLRPRIQWLGTSDEERTATYPGDDLIPSGRRYGAMATTIAAPPERVWPWLVQMGCDRAGFYSFDRLDNGGRPSADRIHPQWQNLREGDRIASAPDASRWFDVALLVPERALVLRASLTVPAARNFDPAGGLPRAYSDSTWGFFLRPTVDGHTRLVVTGKARGKPHALIAVANWLLWDPAHWVMQLKQFAGLRRRAESVPNGPAATPATEGAAASGPVCRMRALRTAQRCPPNATLGDAPARLGVSALGRTGPRAHGRSARPSAADHRAPLRADPHHAGAVPGRRRHVRRRGVQRRRRPPPGLVPQPARQPARPDQMLVGAASTFGRTRRPVRSARSSGNG